MEQSNKLFSYAVTISIYSGHKLNKFLTKHSSVLDTIKCDSYQDLNVEQQDEYLQLTFTSPLLSRKIEHCYAFEYHTNIVLKGGMPKRHLHGTIKNITKETLEELKKLYLNSYLKVKTDKAINDCFRCVPIIDEKGWDIYIHKEQESAGFVRYFNDLENHLSIDYTDDTYKFGCLNRNFCPININVKYK